MTQIRPIAFYLPQYHTIPENDIWWGKGFTEWTNVVRARPLFRGHYQPHLPADLGFYDLRLPEVREAQAKMAAENGIYGFCYYHYWFNGKRLLNRPVDDIIRNGEPDFPFMLCWANENWTRAWDGQDKDILIEQKYSYIDDREHIEFLCKNIFPDKRYIKVYGKPVFVIYKAQSIPDIKLTIEIWREIAVKYGFKGLYLIKVMTGKDRSDPVRSGFDAAVEFQPDWNNLPLRIKPSLVSKLLYKINIKKSAFINNSVFDYNELVKNALRFNIPDYKFYRCVTPSWDNSARKKNKAHIFINSSPEAYGNWLSHTIKNFRSYSKEENFIFINAWNEWAEGNHLEPCQKWGMKYLYETKRVIHEQS